MALSDEVKTRYGTIMLAQLTNEDAAATTIDDTVLDAAAVDAIGDFERVSGKAFDIDFPYHVTIAVQGVLYKLMEYKNIDSRARDKYESAFYGALGAINRRGYTSPATSSQLLNKREKQNTLPDMNKQKRIFGRVSTNRITEINDGD